MIGSRFQKSGLYIFVIAVACVYYLLSAQLLLAHFDLGWHLAAGDLIIDQGDIPVHDPWSFTSGGKQWLNLSWLWDVIASLVFQLTSFGGLVLFAVACGAVIAGCLTSVCLKSGASTLAVGISAPESAREFTEGFCELSAFASPLAAPLLFAEVGAVPETATSTGVFAATESRRKMLNPCCCPAGESPAPLTCTGGVARIATRAAG